MDWDDITPPREPCGQVCPTMGPDEIIHFPTPEEKRAQQRRERRLASGGWLRRFQRLLDDKEE